MPTPMDIFVKKMQEIFCPDEVYIMDGSQEEAERLTEIAQKSEVDGRVVLKKLNGQEYPNSYYHCSNPNDVARTEHLTFVCTPVKDQAGPNNNWLDPKDAKEKMKGLLKAQ